jgi:hypothetical protein
MKDSSRRSLAIAFALVIALNAAACGGGGSGGNDGTEVTATTIDGPDTTTPTNGGELSEP